MARLMIAVGSLLAFLVAAPAANAAITSVFSNTTTPIPCTVQGNGVRLCDQTTFAPAQTRSTVRAFDGVPIDVRVAFPPVPPTGPDGPYPLIMLFHGYAGSKLSLTTMQPWLDRGYATFSMTTRGFGESCGTSAARSADPAGCANGYVRLMDTRYEVRDAQEMAGLLADEGRSSPTQIGAIGGSYGGGMSMALATLKNRKMLPNGSLIPWTSPNATPMQIAAATPEIPWTDLAYSLLPNGSTLDYVTDAPYMGRSGVLKESWENQLFNAGIPFFYAPSGSDPDADLNNWHVLFNNGEPYDDGSGNPLPAVVDVRDELTTHHSSYYIDHSQAPAPLLISSGFTDDLFPADEAIRFYNRTRTQHPGADISLFFGSFGHQRGQNKSADIAQRTTAEQAWMDYYVKGVGGVPFHGVKALTQTCPAAAASGGPFSAGNWASIAPGEIRFDSAAPKTILPTAGSLAIGNAFDPFGSAFTGGACSAPSATDQADTATYRMSPVPAGQNFTVMGSPTVIADITSTGSNSQIAARLLDVNTSTNTETLVARGLWRPRISSTPVRQVFQLHPNGYQFAAGRVVKLELLPKDSPYGRTSNGQANVTVQNLQLRLPVLESAGAVGGLVQEPAPKVVPQGYELARDWQQPYPRPNGAAKTRLTLVPAHTQCTSPTTDHAAPFPSGAGNDACASTSLSTDNLTVPNDDSSVANGSVTFRFRCANAGTPPDCGAPGDQAEAAIIATVNDVRCAATASGSTGCGASNTTPGADYTGQLLLRLPLRITDTYNGLFNNVPATLADAAFTAGISCTATGGDLTRGSGCSLTTSTDAILPDFGREDTRALVALGQVEVRDAGDNGTLQAGTIAGAGGTCPPQCRGDGDEQAFMRQGVFVP